MAIVDLRQHTGYLLAVLLLGQVILISTQVTSHTGVPVLAEATFEAFSEVQLGVAAVTGGVAHVWQQYVALHGVRADNVQLQTELAAARVQLQEERALAQRSRTLEQLLGLKDRSDLATVAADVIAASATPDFRTVTIDKGTDAGLHRDMAVIAPGGVAGRIVMTGTDAAQVQLLIDHSAAAGALDQRSRAQGIVMGDGGARLQMQYVAETADIRSGDTVVTSGIDGIYPKGFVIGRVTTVEHGVGGYKFISVTPAVDFSSLEEVLAVVTPPPSRQTGAGRE